MNSSKELHELHKPRIEAPSSKHFPSLAYPFRALRQVLLSAFFPQDNRCHSCHSPLIGPDEPFLCRECQQELTTHALPAGDQPYYLDALLPETYAAYRHQGTPRTLIHRLKYSGDLHAAAPLAEGMTKLYVGNALVAPIGVPSAKSPPSKHLNSRAASAVAQEGPAMPPNDFANTLSHIDLLLPIPLHPKRLKTRGYNQAEVLARQLSFHTGQPCLPQALARTRHTRQQVGQIRKDRLQNMHGAFSVPDRILVCGRRILLIDDVCTTGATALACAGALLDAGAAHVALLTVCKA